MRSTSVAFVFAATFVLFLSLNDSRAQDATVSEAPPPPPPPPGSNGTCCRGGKGKGGHGHHKNQNRVSRSAPPDTLEDKFKDFAAKLGKTPDELRAAFGKFMLAQGVSLQQMEEEIQRGRDAAMQMVESIKKAMHV